MKRKDPVVKLFVGMVVIGLLLSGVMLLRALVQAEVHDYASCVEAGHPIITSKGQEKCVSPNQAYDKP